MFRMFRLPLVAAIFAAAVVLPPAAHSAVVSICNSGNTNVSVAVAIYSKSLLFGNSYRVSGWYTVGPHKCEVMYSADTPDPIYLGFTYRDSANVLRTHVSEPSTPDDLAKAVSEKLCVAPNDAFDYTTRTKGAGCQEGYKPLEFSLYFALDEGNTGRVSYTVSPDKSDREGAALTMPAGTARLIFGDEVHFDGTHWTFANGSRVPEKLLAKKTGEPPLMPKEQHSTTQPPVAAYVAQIRNVFSAFKPCSISKGNDPVTSVQLDIDSSGVIISQMSSPEKLKRGAAIANLDLAHPTIDTSDNDCTLFGFDCKDGAQCARSKDDYYDSTAVDINILVNTREQVDSVINALRHIAPYYPEGEGEVH